MNHPIMQCGCVAQGVGKIGGMKKEGPVCVVHLCLEIADKQPDLKGRMASCCGKPVPSDPEHLAFFEYRPDRETDRYYCGHSGWD